MGLFLIILTSIILLSYLWIKKRFSYWTEKGFLQVDGSFPLGSLAGIGTKVCSVEKYDGFYKSFKGKASAVGFYSFLSPVLLPINPDVVKAVLSQEFLSFHNRGLFYNTKDDPISSNLLTLEGQEWKDRRIKMTPMFSSGKIKMMFDIIDMIGDQLVDAFSNSIMETKHQEMRKWAERFTNDTIGNVAFGLEFSCLQNEDSDFLKYGKRLFHLKPHEIFKVLFASVMPEIGRALGFRFTSKEPGDFFMRTFLETLEYREKNNINRNDFVTLLLNMKKWYKPTELAAEAFLIYMGGYETSSSLISYVIYELALNQDIQNRLRQEIASGIEENNEKLTYEVLTGYKYLDMVVNEGLRKFPPAPLFFRKCTKDYRFPDTNLVISKGTSVIINSFSLHRDPEYFPDPEIFNPERFNDENIKNIKPFTYLPFGEGQRNCIGKRLGQMQTKIALVKLIKNFKFYSYENTQVPIKFNPSSVFIEPKNGIWLKVEKIADS